MLDPYSEGVWGLCYAVGGILLAWLEGRITANQYRVVVSDQLYPMMVSEWFDEY